MSLRATSVQVYESNRRGLVSVSEVTTLWRYISLITIIIITVTNLRWSLDIDKRFIYNLIVAKQALAFKERFAVLSSEINPIVLRDMEL